VTAPAVTARALTALAVADFRERTRRPAYLVTLAAAVVLGWLALPPPSSVYVIMNAGGYRGVYNSAYAGTVTALAGGLWLMIGGFYVVRGAIARDEHTRVGQILAATPLRSAGYLAGKFVSNLLVLVSMAGVLAVTALALQLARGESLAVDPAALLTPYLLLTLPVLAVTAAAAAAVETVPVLRGGVGNIAWFFVWMITAIAGAGAPLGGLGTVAASMRHAMAVQHLHPAEFSVGFTKVDHPLHTFAWAGLTPPGGFVAGRLALLLVAVCLAALPAAWFGRFDPARARPRGAAAPVAEPAPVPATAGAAVAADTVLAEGTVLTEGTVPPAGRAPRPAAVMTYRPLPSAGSRRRWAFRRLLVGETRILVQGTSRWWWLVAAAVNVAGAAVPANLVRPTGASSALLLSAAWIWPVLIWSRLGTQRRENGLDTLLGAYPGAARQLVAEWTAGVVLTAATGLGPLLRIVAVADGPRAAAWAAGAVFIPSLALLAGTASRTHRMFQALYLIAWYAAVNQVAAADYMGTVLVHGRPAGPSPLFTAGLAAFMLAIALTIRTARHATR
jgi:hypothetical protein